MRRTAIASLSVLAVLGTACGGGGGTPSEQLADALADLRGTDFSYEVALDIDNDVLSSAAASDPTIGQASLFAGSFTMRGSYVDDDSSFSVGVMGTDAFAMRLIDDASEVYLQFGVVDLLAGFGADPQTLLDEMGAQGGLPEGLDTFVQAFLSGGWVGFENDQEAFEAAIDDEYRAQYGDPAQMREAFEPLVARFSDPEALLAEYGTVTEADQVDGVDQLKVDVKLRSLLGDVARDFAAALESQDDNPAFSDLGADMGDLEAELADVPESVPGLTVGVRDGKVETMVFDLGVAAAAMGEDTIEPGAALITITLDRTDVDPITAPSTDTFFTTDQLVQLLQQASMADAA